MFILSFITSSSKVWAVSNTSVYENSESKLFKNIKFLGEICSNWSNDLLEINIYKILEFC